MNQPISHSTTNSVDGKRVTAVYVSEAETKSVEPDNTGLRPEETALPDALPDPHGVGFTDEQIELLTATDNDAAKALAFATATPEKVQLLKAKEG